MTAAARAPDKPRVHQEPWWLLVDPFLALSAAAIAAMGSVLVYSATRGAVGDFVEPDRALLWRQGLFAAVGLAGGVAVAMVSPRHLKRFWPLAFAAMIAALWAVLEIGVEVNGTRGWFSFESLSFDAFRLQPSEPGKLVVIVGLALALSPRSGEVGLLRLLSSLGLVAAPVMLLLLQPDVGTILVYLAVTVTVVVVSGVRVRWMAALALLALAGAFWVLRSDSLADYQQARLSVFLSESSDGSAQAEQYAYNAEQAQVAVGNGGLGGQGLFQGTQTASGLVPSQETDFIFTVAGEELGFQGSSLLLGLYALLLFRVWRTAQISPDRFGRLVCIGVFAMFLFQMFQAVGMTMGMMPVTGIPLPLVSYGGSSMLTSMAGLGLVAGVYRRRLDPEGAGRR